MATTDTRPGFRLPWSGDHRDAEATAVVTEAEDEATRPEGAEASDSASIDTADEPAGAGADGPTGTADHVPFGAEAYAPAPTPAARPESVKKPTKFMADLAKAMRATAETERGEIVERFQGEAKTFIESIHERSATDVVDLRKRAEDDIAGIRDWSKAEIARIREQTDLKISDRKRDLDEELEAHAARVEREIERIRSTVDGFEAQMARFFEELLAVDDPTRIAAMAGNLPEPPSLDDVAAGIVSLAPPAVEVPAEVPTVEATTTEAAPDEVTSEQAAEVDEAIEAAVASESDDPWRDVAFDAASPDGEDGTGPDVPEPAAAEDDHVPSGASGEATPIPTIEWPSAAGETVGPSTEPEATLTTDATPQEAATDSAPLDPRVAALGLTPDLAAAEAEAFVGASAEDDGSAEDVPVLDDETIAARLASLTAPGEPAIEPMRTQVVVTGLASVASISGFKRTLAQLAGVRQVSVASGPDGEFVFTVTHGPAVDLAAIVPSMSGFAARVLSAGDDVIRVAARDPESVG